MLINPGLSYQHAGGIKRLAAGSRQLAIIDRNQQPTFAAPSLKLWSVSDKASVGKASNQKLMNQISSLIYDLLSLLNVKLTLNLYHDIR